MHAVDRTLARMLSAECRHSRWLQQLISAIPEWSATRPDQVTRQVWGLMMRFSTWIAQEKEERPLFMLAK
jgi:lauroyl/myristoyl acyltransferase